MWIKDIFSTIKIQKIEFCLLIKIWQLTYLCHYMNFNTEKLWVILLWVDYHHLNAEKLWVKFPNRYCTCCSYCSVVSHTILEKQTIKLGGLWSLWKWLGWNSLLQFKNNWIVRSLFLCSIQVRAPIQGLHIESENNAIFFLSGNYLAWNWRVSSLQQSSPYLSLKHCTFSTFSFELMCPLLMFLNFYCDLHSKND